MRFATYTSPRDGEPVFGVVIEDELFSLAALQREAGEDHDVLRDALAYVSAPVEAQAAAEGLVRFCRRRFLGDAIEVAAHERIPVANARLRAPLPAPAALIDFALTPRHLLNSARTIVRHEFGWLKRLIALRVVAGRIEKARTAQEFPYYKGNHHAMIGDGEATCWPRYTSYLDIEPELAVITGPSSCPIAGYTILNDFSARDVQFPELEGLSLTRSKDFDRGNGLGPFLVTPDEVGDPLNLDVTVRIGERHTWRGSSREYQVTPDDALRYLTTVFTPAPGTVVGLGTIPGCCGLDNDCWVVPGDQVEITFDRLGTLHQPIPAPAAPLQPSRWAPRSELAAFAA